jgi:hypothetical protein
VSSLRLVALAAAGVTLAAAAVAQQGPAAGGGGMHPPPGVVALEGACASRTSAGCERCEIVLRHEVELPATGGALRASCPGMVSGRYELGVAVPVRLSVPGSGAARADARPRPTFFQVFASFGAQGRDARGHASALLPETPRASWSWWNPSGMTVDRTEIVENPERAAIEVTFRLDDPQYYLPARAEGAAHHDGRLFVAPGTVIRLTGVPARATAQAAEARDFNAATLAEVVPAHTTKAQVRSLLGEPWRDTPHGDDEHPVNDVWDYLGRSAAGTYLVHIEFDQHGLVRLMAKIPEKSGVGAATVAKDPRASGKP